MTTIRVCTFVTDWSEYEDMKRSMPRAGYDEQTDFHPLDNTRENAFDPFREIPKMIEETDQDILLVCHQDVRFGLSSERTALLRIVDQLRTMTPGWAVCGPAGVSDGMDFVVALRDPVNDPLRKACGGQPVAAHSLDECCLIFRPQSALRTTAGLSGFHLYGTDLALNARKAGLGAYVVDLSIAHLSAGTFDETFTSSAQRFSEAWNRRFVLFYTLRAGELCLARNRMVRWIGSRARVRSLMQRRAARRILLAQLRSR